MVPTKLKSGGDASPPSPTDLRPCKYCDERVMVLQAVQEKINEMQLNFVMTHELF